MSISWLFLGTVLATSLPPSPEAIRLETTSGTLHGSLDLPAQAGPVPLVILLAGSGPTDRDGNQRFLKNDSLKQLGQGLATRGIAVLRYDRRGVGQSAAAWSRKEEEFRFEMLAEDVLLWVDKLKTDRRFSRIILAGHSEGALVSLLAAKRVPVAGYVSLAGAGRPAPEVLREQLGKNLPAQRARWEPIVKELEAGRLVPEVPKDLQSLFRPSVQPYLLSLFKIDPARELKDLTIPVLIVQGTTDVQESVAGARRLAGANNRCELVLIEGMNHVLKHAVTALDQQATYVNPATPVVPEVIDAVAGFVLKKAQ